LAYLDLSSQPSITGLDANDQLISRVNLSGHLRPGDFVMTGVTANDQEGHFYFFDKKTFFYIEVYHLDGSYESPVN
jgi:hypothetical protein